MKLNKVRQQHAPAYPTMAEYQAQRDVYLRRLALGTGALLAVGVVGACGEVSRPVGSAPAAKPVTERPVTRLPGEMPAPKPPAVCPANAAPAPAVAPPVALQGDIAFPTPPPQPTPLTPGILGEPRAPEPPRPPPQVLGTPPVVPAAAPSK